MYQVISTEQFEKWFLTQTSKTQGQISARLERIKEFGHFGEAKHLSNELAELKWKNGLRLYFSVSKDLDGSLIIVLLGGNKNSQKKDIQKAKRLLTEFRHKD